MRRCAGWQTLLAVVALMLSMHSDAETLMPSEIKALVGMKLPPKVYGQEQARIPGYSEAGGRLLGLMQSKTPKARLAYSDGIFGEWPLLVVQAIYEDRSIEILDIHILPADLINWRYVNGRFQWLDDRYDLTQCYQQFKSGKIIVGLVRPESKPRKGMEGFSSRVKRAWEIDQRNGQITAISTKDVQCEIIGD